MPRLALRQKVRDNFAMPASREDDLGKLEIDNARVRFGNYDALKSFSLTVEDGQFVTLLGPSGCGKTTLLKSVAGFVPLTAGSIRIAGADMTNVPPERRDTALCFQSYALFPHLTVAENIIFGLRQKRTAAAERTDRLDQVAAQVSLQTQLDKLPGQLSGGQQQRVALARAMAVRPGVLLFDEPLSNLDAKLRDQVRLEIRQLQRAHGFTALYVTHDQSEALAMSDQVVVMNAGAIEQVGTPLDIYYRPVNRFVADFIGTANILPAQVVGKEATSIYSVTTPMGPARIFSVEEPISDHLYICWRPEDAELVDAPDATSNVFSLTVRSRTFLGSITDVGLGAPDVKGQTFRIQTAGYADLVEGAACHFRIAPEKFRMLREAVA